MAVARRFAVGGYQVTLVARSTDGLRDLAGTLAGTGAKINTIAADASDPDGLATSEDFDLATCGDFSHGHGHRASSSITPLWELQTGC
jgi:short-subunit dehydrogenase